MHGHFCHLSKWAATSASEDPPCQFRSLLDFCRQKMVEEDKSRSGKIIAQELELSLFDFMWRKYGGFSWKEVRRKLCKKKIKLNKKNAKVVSYTGSASTWLIFVFKKMKISSFTFKYCIFFNQKRKILQFFSPYNHSLHAHRPLFFLGYLHGLISPVATFIHTIPTRGRTCGPHIERKTPSSTMPGGMTHNCRIEL